MKFLNLTPHPIVLRRADGSDLTIAPRPAEEGGSARVSSTHGAQVGDANGVPVFSAPAWGEVTGLPAPEAETIYIVSGLVLGRVTGRPDVCGPGTGPADGPVRNADGQVVAVTRLIQAG